jgi:hypothetical protein
MIIAWIDAQFIRQVANDSQHYAWLGRVNTSLEESDKRDRYRSIDH